MTTRRLALGSGIGLLLVAGVLLLARAALHERLVAPSIPVPEEFTVPPVTSDSTILVDARVSLSALENLANAKIPQSFRGREDDPTNALYDDSVSFRVSRGPLSISAADGAMRLVAPITDGAGTIQGRFGARGWFGRSFASFPVSATVNNIRGQVSARLAPVFRPNWTIHPNASIDLDLSNADLRVKHVGTVSMRGFLERKFDKEKKDLVKKLTDFLTTTNDLRDSMKATWERAFVVEKLGEEAAWFVVRPTGVLAAPLSAQGEHLHLAFGMTAQGQVVFQESAPENLPTPLPSLTIVQQPAARLELNLPVAIDYQVASAAVRGHLPEESFDVGGTKVRVDELSVQGAGNRLLLNADVTGTNGWLRRTTVSLTIVGRPHLDPGAKILSITDLEFDLTTKNYLLKAAGWALDPIILQELQQASVFDLAQVESKLVEEARLQLEKAKGGLPAGVTADVDLSQIRLNDLRLTREKLFLVLQASGTLRVQLDEIPIQ